MLGKLLTHQEFVCFCGLRLHDILEEIWLLPGAALAQNAARRHSSFLSQSCYFALHDKAVIQ
jgi:hypothetical protein